MDNANNARAVAIIERVNKALYPCSLVCFYLRYFLKRQLLGILEELGRAGITDFDRVKAERIRQIYSLATTDPGINTEWNQPYRRDANWNFPFNFITGGYLIKPKSPIKRLALRGDRKKQWQYLVTKMIKGLQNLVWLDFHGHEGCLSFARRVELDRQLREEWVNFTTAHANASEGSARRIEQGDFRRNFRVHVTIPLVVQMGISVDAVERIYRYWTDLNSLVTNRTQFHRVTVGMEIREDNNDGDDVSSLTRSA